MALVAEQRDLGPIPESLRMRYPVGPGTENLPRAVPGSLAPTLPAQPKPVATTSAPTPPAPAKAKRVRTKTADNSVIRVLVTEFGHKPGSKAETKSNGLRDGMTVAEYVADDLGIAGNWHKGHISHCLGKGFIKLEDNT